MNTDETRKKDKESSTKDTKDHEESATRSNSVSFLRVPSCPLVDIFRVSSVFIRGYFPGDSLMAWRCTLVLALLAALSVAIAQPPGVKPAGPLSPREAMTTFRVPKGFKVELVACEPQVIDPVAMAFDEQGRIFVAEMPGYPNGGIAEGKIASGRIKLLEDKDGDGFYETS